MGFKILGGQTKFTNDLGQPLVGGQIYTFYAGTSTPQDTYTDALLTIPNTNPIRLDDAGSAEIFLKGSYRVRVFDALGRFIEEQDNLRQTISDADAGLLIDSILSTNTELNKVKLDTGITATAKNGGVARTQAEKNADYISIKDFGLVADGVADDSLKLQTIESAYTNRQIDMLGMDVAIASLPTNNSYYNGRFIVGGKAYSTNKTEDTVVTNRGVFIGNKVAKLPLNHSSSIVAVGEGALSNISGNARSLTAIGFEALKNAGSGSVYNIAVGGQSQYGNKSGTRNVSMGDNSLRFNTTGANNIAIGRNAAQCIKDSSFNVAIGSNAMSGFGSLKFKDLDYIGITTPITSNNSTAVGYNASFYGGGSNSTALGAQAFINAKSGATNSTAIGYKALNSIGVGIGIFGGAKTTLNISATYIMTASTVSITAVGLDAVVGDYIHVNFQDGIPIYESTTYRDLQIYKIKTKSGDTYTMDEPDGIAASGNVIIIAKESASTPPETNQNTAVGFESLSGLKSGKHNVAVGGGALNGAFIGVGNIGIGDYALANLSLDSDYNIAIGYGAMRFQQSGGIKTQGVGCIAIGNDSRVSGDNQLQLGRSGVSTYAYGAVQDRSDARDKIIEGDITDAHINFFNDLEFKRYRLDYRDDYLIVNDDGTLTKLEKDGSKAGKREHVGVIAQQVEQAMKAHGVDFAGLQHHAVNGGNDVYTVGYQEFIPILGEIVQRQQKQIDELMALIKK